MGPQERCKTKATRRDQILKCIVVEEHMVTQISRRKDRNKRVQSKIIMDKMLCKYIRIINFQLTIPNSIIRFNKAGSDFDNNSQTRKRVGGAKGGIS